MNAEALARQIKLQNKLAWDLERDVPWQLGVDHGRMFLPLDEMAIAFPGASAEQRLALSQFMGLVVNATISEMEDALPKLKDCAWARILRDYPANPELEELGEMFFDEEAKHARAFAKYLDTFCNSTGIEKPQLDALLPKAFGSFFQKAITANAFAGGHAFWWVVASVEEVSIGIYQQMHKHKDAIDPLYMQLHRRHLEEEARHANYAYLMLGLVQKSSPSFKRMLHKKADFVFAQIVGAPWVVTELYKFFRVKDLADKDPFFAVLKSCIPLFEAMPKRELIRRMFFAAPYVSWLLNPTWRETDRVFAKQHGAIVPPIPAPDDVTFVMPDYTKAAAG